MSMKSILAPIDGTATSNGVLQAAFVLAGAFKAHVNALHVRPAQKQLCHCWARDVRRHDRRYDFDGGKRRQ